MIDGASLAGEGDGAAVEPRVVRALLGYLGVEDDAVREGEASRAGIRPEGGSRRAGLRRA
jgi:hypothetical protein